MRSNRDLISFQGRRRRARWALPNQRGASLIELLIVVVLLAIIIPALISGFTAAFVTVKDARMLELAKHIAQMTMEDALASEEVIAGGRDVPGYPGYSCYVETETDFADGSTTVVVTVEYTFLTGRRQHRMVAVLYAR